MATIRSKIEFFRLWELGVLGNRNHLFYDEYEAALSGFNEIGFRQIGVPGGAWEKVPWYEAPNTAKKWRDAGRIFVMDSGADDPAMTLQGEVCRTFRGLEGYLGLAHGLPMRKAMAAGYMTARTGAEVKVLLNTYMDPSSQDDLDALLELFPDATVEFTCFNHDIGVIPGRNTIFWETRDY
jgi:hypothetical protein